MAALACTATPAQEDGGVQPARIFADRVEIDRPAGVSRYYGDVVFTQGTLRITGERLLLRAPGGVVERAEAHGEPATIRKRTERGTTVHARARHIVYKASEALIILTGHARLWRGGEHFSAGRIQYDLETGRIQAGRGEGGGRVRIRIVPQRHQDAEPATETDRGS